MKAKLAALLIVGIIVCDKPDTVYVKDVESSLNISSIGMHILLLCAFGSKFSSSDTPAELFGAPNIAANSFGVWKKEC